MRFTTEALGVLLVVSSTAIGCFAAVETGVPGTGGSTGSEGGERRHGGHRGE